MNPPRVRRPRRRPLDVLVASGFVALGSALALWIGGFLWFAAHLDSEVTEPGRITDAIVVLTGGSARLDTGLGLLDRGLARKLFVSGVGRRTPRAVLRRLAGRMAERFECCVVLGHDAENTAGNAAETARWMAAEGYRSLRIVTTSYHMPRSLIEFRRALPDAELVANPVFTAHVKLDRWWEWRGTTLLVADEFNKYLFSLMRSRLTRTGPQRAAS